MKKHRLFTLLLMLPLALNSCKKNDAAGAAEANAPAAAPAEAADTHMAIAKDMAELMGTMTGMTKVTDEASADVFVEEIKAMPDKFEALLARVKALPAPTDEQKAEVKALLDKREDEINKEMSEFQASIQASGEKPKFMEYGEKIQGAMTGMDERMSAASAEFEKAYNLKD